MEVEDVPNFDAAKALQKALLYVAKSQLLELEELESSNCPNGREPILDIMLRALNFGIPFCEKHSSECERGHCGRYHIDLGKEGCRMPKMHRLVFN